MDDIFLKSKLENNPTYIDVIISFNICIDELFKDTCKIGKILDKMKNKFHAKNINFYVDTFKKKIYKSELFHSILQINNIDLYISFESGKHFICFSHHLMDGFSFMLFLIEFYSNYGFQKYDYINKSKIKEKIIESNITNLLNFTYWQISNILFVKETCTLPTVSNSKLSFNSSYIYKRKNKSFNLHVCSCIENALLQMKVIKKNYKIIYGLPINYKTLKERTMLPYGNYICILPEKTPLTFCKNKLVILLVLIITFFISCFPKEFVNDFCNYCLGKIDIIYSNIDAQVLDTIPFVESIQYNVPAFEQSIMSFSCITWKGQVFFSINTKRQFSLNLFKNCFLSYYECRD